MSDFTIISASAKVNGVSIVDGGKYPVDRTKAQTISISWEILNALGGWQIWTGCVTAYDMTNNKKLSWGKSAADFHQGLGSETLPLGVVTKPTKIRLNVMATQTDFARAREPDVALQKARK